MKRGISLILGEDRTDLLLDIGNLQYCGSRKYKSVGGCKSPMKPRGQINTLKQLKCTTFPGLSKESALLLFGMLL